MTNLDVHGPIDFTMIEFPRDASGVATAEALVDLVESGTVRLYDVMVVGKEADGSVAAIHLEAPPDGPLRELQSLTGARSGLIDDDDLPDIAEMLEPETFGVLLVYENAWAVPFVAAARSEGAQLVASARLSAQDIIDALDSIDASD